MTRLNIRLQPRASSDVILGWTEADAQKMTLRVRVKAPPVDGEANEALIGLLAKSLGVARKGIVLVTGATGRNKIVEIDGVSDEQLRIRLNRHLAQTK